MARKNQQRALRQAAERAALQREELNATDVQAEAKAPEASPTASGAGLLVALADTAMPTAQQPAIV